MLRTYSKPRKGKELSFLYTAQNCGNNLFISRLKAHANGRNKRQQLPTLLDVVGQQCCVRLHGPKRLTGFILYATSANKCQHCCGSMQTDATSHNIVGPNNVGCCWPTMLGPFALALMFVSATSAIVYLLISDKV